MLITYNKGREIAYKKSPRTTGLIYSRGGVNQGCSMWCWSVAVIEQILTSLVQGTWCYKAFSVRGVRSVFDGDIAN